MGIKLGIRDIEESKENKELFKKYDGIKKADRLCLYYASVNKDEEGKVICDTLYNDVMLSKIKVPEYFDELKQKHRRNKSFIRKIDKIVTNEEVTRDGKTDKEA